MMPHVLLICKRSLALSYPYSHYRRRRCHRQNPEKERRQLHFHAMLLELV